MNKHKAAVALGIVGATLFAYSRWIEPSWIEVTRHEVSASIERPLKIIHLSDLHTYEFGVRETKVLEIIRLEEPDRCNVLKQRRSPSFQENLGGGLGRLSRGSP